MKLNTNARPAERAPAGFRQSAGSVAANCAFFGTVGTEAFATVKEATRRLMGKEITFTGTQATWDMIPYDVQLVGAIALHR